MSDSERLAISLKELVASGCLSKCAFLLSHEDETRDIEKSIRNLRCTNDSKISLILAQTLVSVGDDYCDQNSNITIPAEA